MGNLYTAAAAPDCDRIHCHRRSRGYCWDRRGRRETLEAYRVAVKHLGDFDRPRLGLVVRHRSLGTPASRISVRLWRIC